MSFLFVDCYLRVGGKFSYIAVSLVGALLSYSVWLELIQRFGRHRSWAISKVVFGLRVFPVAFIVTGIGIWFFRVDERRAGIISRRIEERAARRPARGAIHS